ncbi:MAG: CDP-alcohol phosphatidyltransferase family protein [Planctomycetota bacterium]
MRPAPDDQYEVTDRRPMPPREWAVMRGLTEVAVRLRLSANAVSVLSVVFASASGAALVLTTQAHGWTQRGLWLVGAAGIELRALCNLLDGMVAVRTGTASPVGELYNEVPDRLSDVAMLAGLGYAAGAPTLGWAAACAAVMVAYARAQAAVAGAGQDYGGPMSKPVRMQVVAVVCIACAFAPHAVDSPLWFFVEDSAEGRNVHGPGWVEGILILLIAGCVTTTIARLVRASRRLRKGAA